MSILEPASIALARQMPWTVAEQESIWLITGRDGQGVEFVDCLAYVLPHYVTEGQVVFVFIGALSLGKVRDYIAPHMITRASELILTHASQPLTAFYDRDQPLIDRAPEEKTR